MSTMPLFQRDPDEAGYLSVHDLTLRVKGVLEADFEDVGVVGEITGLSRPGSGHVYFSLKDQKATLRAVIWRSGVSKLRFELSNGLAVRARGCLTVFPPRGEYQLQVKTLEPEGIGALDLAFQQLCRKLEAEGLFARERKRPLSLFPERIVVVSSPTGAAVRDVLQVLGRRWPLAEVLIASTRVQGTGSADEIVKALELANRLNRADFIILTRGGGSREDLWSFNEESVARAVAASRLPVVSAVGHETDVSITDLVADARALTPSEAAERCVPEADVLAQTVDLMGERLNREVQRILIENRGELDRLTRRLAFAARGGIGNARGVLVRYEDRLRYATRDRLAAERQATQQLGERLGLAFRAGLEARKQRLLQKAAQLEALGPLAVLMRGYSLTQEAATGHVVRDAARLSPGQLLRSRLGRGSVLSRVESIEPSNKTD